MLIVKIRDSRTQISIYCLCRKAYYFLIVFFYDHSIPSKLDMNVYSNLKDEEDALVCEDHCLLVLVYLYKYGDHL
jgi:hypothetical protein